MGKDARTVHDGQVESLALLRGGSQAGDTAESASARKDAERTGAAAWAADPRPVLRGSDCQTGTFRAESAVGLHWLRGSCPREVLPEAVELLSRYFCSAERALFGFWGFTDRLTFGGGLAHVCYDLDLARAERVHGDKLTVEISGDALDLLSPERLLELVQDLADVGFVCGRVDVMWDDYERLVSVESVREAALRGDFTGFRRFAPNFQYSLHDGGVSLERSEMDFGRRGSGGGGKYLRVYDKQLESKGVQDCVRWEFEFCGDQAAVVFLMLVAAGDVGGLGKVIGSLVGGGVSFLERASAGGNGHLDRMSLCPWWAKIVELLGQVRLRLPRVVQRLKKAVVAMFHQYGAVMLAADTLFRRHGEPAGLWRLFQAMVAEVGLKPRHWAMVNAAGSPVEEFGLDALSEAEAF